MTPRLTIDNATDAVFIAAALTEAARTAETVEATRRYRELAALARAEYGTDLEGLVALLDATPVKEF